MLHFQPRSNSAANARIGLVIGKKLIKSAVRRNLVKRLARERFRQQHAGLNGYDLVLRLISKPVKMDRHMIVTEITTLFTKLRPVRGRVANEISG